MIVLLAALACAGWVRQPVTGAGEEIPLELRVGDGLLLRVTPTNTPFTVTDAGAPVRVWPGLDRTWWVPASDRPRDIVVHADHPVRVEHWRDEPRIDSPAWNRYSRALARWCQRDGELPHPPGRLDGLEDRWTTRRDTLRAAGEWTPAFCLASTWLELEGVRARGLSDHPPQGHSRAALAPQDVFRDDVRGVGVWVLDARAILPDPTDRADISLRIALDGHPVERVLRTAGANPDSPGLGWARSATVVVPPGAHRITVVNDGDPIHVTTHLERLQLPLAHVNAFDALDHPTGPTQAMEAAALFVRPEANTLAKDLMYGPAADAALAQRIDWEPDPDEIAALAEPGMGPRSRAAWAHRARIVGDLLPDRLRDEPPDWVGQAEDVAYAAYIMDPSAVRPRDASVRRAAGVQAVSTGTRRWTALPPDGDGELRRLDGARGGRARVRVPAGDAATIWIDDAGEGLGRMRAEASEPCRYWVDGVPRYGVGRLDEALTPGSHEILVDAGMLWLLQGAKVTGGVPAREVPFSALPGRWRVPEPGFPARVALVSDPPADVIVEADDGRSWRVSLDDQGTFLDLGPVTSALTVHGPPTTRVAVALERAVEPDPPTLPTVDGDPLEVVRELSLSLVLAPPADDEALADLRIQRAAALIALGFTGSARRELNAVALLPGATAIQRSLAGMPLAAPLPVDEPGPLTAEAALAMTGRLPPDDDSANGWLRAALDTPAALADPVYRRAAERALDDGDVVAAWYAATQGGPLALRAGKTALHTGKFHRIRNVERHGGDVTEVLNRTGPGPDDPLSAHVREALLGAPWSPQMYTVLRRGRRDRLHLEGPADLTLKLLCHDEALPAARTKCPVRVTLGDETTRLDLEDGVITTHTLHAPPGPIDLLIDPKRTTRTAVVTRIEQDGAVVRPTLQITAHRVGAGISTPFAGPGIVRVRVRRGRPVTLHLGDERRVVEDEAIVAITTHDVVDLRISGPSETWVDLARWEPVDVTERDDPVPDPERWVAPVVTSPAAVATRAWVREMRWIDRPSIPPPGRPGTWTGAVVVANDAVGGRDTVNNYRLLQLTGTGRLRLREGRWGRVWASTRLSPDGPIAVGGQARLWFHHTGGYVTTGLRGWGTAGAGHVRGDVELRQRVLLESSWRVEGLGAVRGGVWAGDPTTQVDPVVWTPFATQHPVSVRLGAQAQWSPVLDARLRGRVQAVSNSGPSLDRVEARVQGDVVLRDEVLLTGLAELGLRFRDRDRARAALRPLLGVDATWASWLSPKQRLVARANVRWLPSVGAVEGGVSVALDTSRARGLLDYSPASVPFRDLLDLPAEAR